MTDEIRIGIVGYGNLAKGVEASIMNNHDMSLFGIFTRRNPSLVHSDTKAEVFPYKDIENFVDDIDVVVNCGGSATDLPTTTPNIAKYFNVVDSFDTHAKIPEHFSNVALEANKSSHVAIISVGWDPGLFSLNRLLMMASLPNGNDYTFWGKGISQGHSDAIRRIDGVVDAKQYTVPVKESIDAVRNGEKLELSTRQKHTRECYVVAEDGADLESIKEQIVNMPNYFDEYDTTVNFISKQELEREHSSMPHGGRVIRNGKNGLNDDFNSVMEFSLDLESNPHFTGSVLLAYARAAYNLYKDQQTGCFTVFDIAPRLLLNNTSEYIRSKIL